MKKSIKPTRTYLRQWEKKLKRTYYSELFKKYKNDKKNSLKIKNEISRNMKNKQKYLPEKLFINNIIVVRKQEIAENLNKYFTNISPSLASKIPNKQGGFGK